MSLTSPDPVRFPYVRHRSCLIIEDEPLAQEYMYEYAVERAGLRVTGQANTIQQARTLYAQSKPDIIFLDIEMPGESGIDWLRELIPALSLDLPQSIFPLIVITTAYHQYALQGYELLIADYLLKPITEERYDRMLLGLNRRLATAGVGDSALSADRNLTEETVWLKEGRGRYQLSLSTILYLEGYGDFTNVFTKQGDETKKVLISERLGQIEPQLPAGQFMRVNKSVIINRTAIARFSSREIQTITQKKILIGETYRIRLQQWLG
jgi:two-component system, LytTR family, response regulator